jgi:flagellar motor component MotA
MNTEEFTKEYHKIARRALNLAEKARCEGLLSLEESIDENKYNQRDIMELGLLLVADGTDREIIDKILSNIINLETDSDIKVLKTIKKEAVLSIADGDNPRIMILLLNSYVDIEKENEYAMKQYREIACGLLEGLHG